MPTLKLIARHSRPRYRAVAGAALTTLCLAYPAAVPAAGVVGNGTRQSCADPRVLEERLQGGGTVSFNCGPDPVTIILHKTLTISTNTAIDGGGRITLNPAFMQRVFAVSAGATLTIENTTISDGEQRCGAVDNSGSLSVNACAFLDNHAPFGEGGAVCNRGTMTVTDSSFERNSAVVGGAILNTGTLSIVRSTFSRNRTNGTGEEVGGAIFNEDGNVAIANSTFVRNSALGAGIYNTNEGTARVTNTTFWNNRGWALFNDSDSGAFTLTNTIVYATELFTDTCDGNGFTDGGHNLQFPGTDCGSTIPTSDPKLDPNGLRDNGGRTHTVALTGDSPAIGAGDAAVCTSPPVNGVDQRGAARQVEQPACSIGAYEYTPPAATLAGCGADCNGDGTVDVAELLLIVGVALGQQPLSQCTVADLDGDGQLTVEEILAAVVRALEGCDSEVRDVHLRRLQLFLDGDARRFPDGFAAGAVDLGGGQSGNGQLPAAFFTPQYWESEFRRPQYLADFAGKAIEDIVNAASTRVLSKAQAEAEFGPTLGSATGFSMRDGDLLALTEPAAGSPLTDGWFAVYRRIAGQWLVVALD
jgi:hypothetical protein